MIDEGSSYMTKDTRERFAGCGVWVEGVGVWGVGCGVWNAGCGVWGVGSGL